MDDKSGSSVLKENRPPMAAEKKVEKPNKKKSVYKKPKLIWPSLVEKERERQEMKKALSSADDTKPTSSKKAAQQDKSKTETNKKTVKKPTATPQYESINSPLAQQSLSKYFRIKELSSVAKLDPKSPTSSLSDLADQIKKNEKRTKAGTTSKISKNTNKKPLLEPGTPTQKKSDEKTLIATPSPFLAVTPSDKMVIHAKRMERALRPPFMKTVIDAFKNEVKLAARLPVETHELIHNPFIRYLITRERAQQGLRTQLNKVKLSAAIPKETQFEERNKIRAASNIPTNKEYDALFLAYTKGIYEDTAFVSSKIFMKLKPVVIEGFKKHPALQNISGELFGRAISITEWFSIYQPLLFSEFSSVNISAEYFLNGLIKKEPSSKLDAMLERVTWILAEDANIKPKITVIRRELRNRSLQVQRTTIKRGPFELCQLLLEEFRVRVEEKSVSSNQQKNQKRDNNNEDNNNDEHTETKAKAKTSTRNIIESDEEESDVDVEQENEEEMEENEVSAMWGEISVAAEELFKVDAFHQLTFASKFAIFEHFRQRIMYLQTFRECISRQFFKKGQLNSELIKCTAKLNSVQNAIDGLIAANAAITGTLDDENVKDEQKNDKPKPQTSESTIADLVPKPSSETETEMDVVEGQNSQVDDQPTGHARTRKQERDLEENRLLIAEYRESIPEISQRISELKNELKLSRIFDQHVRIKELGKDRWHRYYWWFANGPNSIALYIEERKEDFRNNDSDELFPRRTSSMTVEQQREMALASLEIFRSFMEGNGPPTVHSKEQWYAIRTEHEFNELMQRLNENGVRERALKQNLKYFQDEILSSFPFDQREQTMDESDENSDENDNNDRDNADVEMITIDDAEE